MIVEVIGLFHLIHSPLLVLFPFIVKNFTTDILYIIYFFTIMFLYTFIDGECPISYICKVMIDKEYIAGSNVTYYPEMEYLLQSQRTINYYFGVMTLLYIATLFFVIFRTNTFSYFLIFTFVILLNYFLFVRNCFSVKNKKFFLIVQEITKHILFLTICFFLTLLLFNSPLTSK
jgi:hypothetical protein